PPTNRRDHELRRSFRHRRASAEGLPRRGGNRELGSRSGRERACVRLGEAAGSERRAILSGAHFPAAGALFTFCCLQVCSLSFRPYVITLCIQTGIKYGRADWPRNRKSAPRSLKNQRHTLEN